MKNALEYQRAYREKNREALREYARQYYHNNRVRYQAYWKKHRQQMNAIGRKRNLRIKREVLSYYGGGVLSCMWCSFGDIRALSIDHIKGGGTQHKKSLGGYKSHLYDWLKQQGFPEGYQTLCMNCQYIKKIENKEGSYGSSKHNS